MNRFYDFYYIKFVPPFQFPSGLLKETELSLSALCVAMLLPPLE